ncbi:MAG: histidine phosphatase family protein [Deltaproteobacteria bacterium]|nr:histidine phosphatase family protein [Deltaproteobacteria bacterium]
MRLLLLRHGATDWNLAGRCQGATDLELNETGFRQAQQAAASLSGEPIDAVYSSDLKRAVQTARFISQPHGLTVTIDASLRELDHGMLEGLTFEEIRASFPEFMRVWRSEPAEAPVPGGERLADVERRAWEGLSRIVERHGSEQTVVIVSHNFPILAVLCRITGTPLNRYRSFQIDPCGICQVLYHPVDRWQLVGVNGKEYSKPG